MDKLIDYICDELEEMERKADKGKLTMADMQYVDMLAHAKKNLLKGDEMGGESYMYADGRMPRYSSARGRNARRDARGRYSSDYAMDSENMIHELRDMMHDAPDERTRMEFERFIKKMESM